MTEHPAEIAADPPAEIATPTPSLRAQVDQLQLRNAELESRAAEADRLSNLLGFREAHADVPTLAARVIGASPDPSSRILFLNRGSRDGVARDMGVITPDGDAAKAEAGGIRSQGPNRDTGSR